MTCEDEDENLGTGIQQSECSYPRTFHCLYGLAGHPLSQLQGFCESECCSSQILKQGFYVLLDT